MAHFVADPEPTDYWVPRIGSMSIPSQNGKAKINVWHPGTGKVTLKVQSGHPRFQFFPNDKGKPHKSGLRRFVVEGLATSDQIAVFDDADNQITAWLTIGSVAIDKRLGLTASRHRARISIDPFGTNSSNYRIDGNTFITKVDAALGRVLANPIGRLVLDAVPGNVVIYFTETQYDTSSTVYGATTQKVIAVEAFYLKGSKAPGATLDEVLLHEFAHHVDKTTISAGDYNDIGDGLKFDQTDFFTVTVTNVYASIYGRPLRKDHQTVDHMIPKYQGSAGEAKFSHAHSANFQNVRRRIGSSLFVAIEQADAPWNPFP